MPNAASAPAPAAPAPLVVASMIVKNEAGNLPPLFDSCAGLIDAWAIVDTGSTDDTVAVAVGLGEKHGIRVFIHEDAWDDDFARSRNVCLDFIDALWGPDDNGDGGHDPWIFILDADDRIVGGDLLRTALEDGADVEIVSLPVVSKQAGSDEVESVVKPWLFKRGLGLRYKYPVHMVLDLDPLRAEPGEAIITGMVEGCYVLHIGYEDPAHREQNWLRALRIVRSKLPEAHPHRLYCEVRSLAALGSVADAAEVARKAITLHNDGDIELDTTAMHIILARFLAFNEGDPDEALQVLADAVLLDARNPDLWANVIMVGALGFLGHSISVARGQPAMSVTAQKAGRILGALSESGLFPNALPAELLTELHEYEARVRALGAAL